MTQQDPARVLFAVAAEGDDEYIWSRLKMLPELFAAGPVAIRVGFFGAEGARSSRPFMVSRWTTDADDLADLLRRPVPAASAAASSGSAAFSSRRCGRRSRGRCEPWSSLVILSTATLRRRWRPPSNCAQPGPGYFLFQQGGSGSTERSFRLLAETTGGGLFPAQSSR